jgi:hypothetical protein
MATVWIWEIRSAKGQILSKGVQYARPYASPKDIADEAMALLVYDVMPRMHLLRGRVCVAWREDDPGTVGESRGDDWIQTAAATSSPSNG